MPPPAAGKSVAHEVVTIDRRSFDRCRAALDFTACRSRSYLPVCPEAKSQVAETHASQPLTIAPGILYMQSKYP